MEFEAFCKWIASGMKSTSFLLGDRQWSVFAPTFSGQKFGLYDTNDCWDYAGVKSIAYSCNFLKSNGYFSDAALNFFQLNKYLDENGLFAFSERYISIVSGVEGNGNSQIQSGILAEKYGLIPRSMLTYTDAQANAQATYLDFCADYYNPAQITDEMYTLGEQFLQYINISPRTITDKSVLAADLQIAPLLIGVPVNDSTWNEPVIPSWVGMSGAQHAITLIGLNSDGSYSIDDQYQPEFKTLGVGYLLDVVNQLIVTPL